MFLLLQTTATLIRFQRVNAIAGRSMHGTAAAAAGAAMRATIACRAYIIFNVWRRGRRSHHGGAHHGRRTSGWTESPARPHGEMGRASGRTPTVGRGRTALDDRYAADERYPRRTATTSCGSGCEMDFELRWDFLPAAWPRSRSAETAFDELDCPRRQCQLRLWVYRVRLYLTLYSAQAIIVPYRII